LRSNRWRTLAIYVGMATRASTVSLWSGRWRYSRSPNSGSPARRLLAFSALANQAWIAWYSADCCTPAARCAVRYSLVKNLNDFFERRLPRPSNSSSSDRGCHVLCPPKQCIVFASLRLALCRADVLWDCVALRRLQPEGRPLESHRRIHRIPIAARVRAPVTI
jgi:hypothetical protein